MPSLRDCLLAGQKQKALEKLKDADRREALNALFFAAAHSKDAYSLVLVDSVREALDYFPEDDKTLLRACALRMMETKKRDWKEPRPVKYSGDPLKHYLDALRSNKPEDARFLSREVLKKVGLKTLADSWLHGTVENPGPAGTHFVVASACRRTLAFADSETTEPLLFWASEYFAGKIPQKTEEAIEVEDFEELTSDVERLKRISMRPGEACSNIVFMHRIKQNLNAVGRHHIAHLVGVVEEAAKKSEEVSLVVGKKDGTLKGLKEALEKEDMGLVAASMGALVDENFDDLCVELLRYASAKNDPKALIAMHAACEIARTMALDTALPLAQATAYVSTV
ncbi:MAG: hypothetical protein HYS81_03610 [Candidatus Aenigmatarchaeota archaeon]|nr:MAG: hypothetical protein HYS81_03610 [Candidatus Aenigmarchaeota archaeon]